MVAGATISADLSDAEWLDALRTLGEKSGSFTDLGKAHSAVFAEQSHDVLLVSFETSFGIRSANENGLPLTFDVCARRGWSHLTMIAKQQSWYRDGRVFAFFDRLIDYGFFDQFGQVIFYGAGMCAYAAAAFSVSAPGATALLIAPQASLDRQRSAWDDRFPSARRLDFTTRYAYAPDMLEAAAAAYVLHDPDEIEDAMHASLFTGSNVHHLRYRRGSAGAIESDMKAMSVIAQACEAAVRGDLSTAGLANILKSRKRHVPYLRALLSRVLNEDRPALTARLCHAVLAEQPLPRFQKQLELAEAQLGRSTSAPSTRPSETNDTGQLS